jgi:Acetyltransferase (GNAT) domain
MPSRVESSAVVRSTTLKTSGLNREPARTPNRSADCSVVILRGSRAVAGAELEIEELRAGTGQANNPLLRLAFFLGRVRLFPGNQPVVLLVRSAEALKGAVYLYEKTFCGVGTGYLRGFDHLTGESSVVAHPEACAWILQFAIQQLFLQTHARVAWATVSQGTAELATGSREERHHIQMEISSICREHRLSLRETFDATLSRFGQHTRRNLRYYRRRAEKELKATFLPALTTQESDEALQQLSEASFQPFPVSQAEWRKMDGLLRTQPGYFAVGLRANGEWLSYLVGMRTGDLTYVLMQMNHNGFARYSLSTVLRSYFFEYEIGLGQAEIKFVNGTCALFQRCCEPDTCLTVSARRGITAFVISNWIAPWHNAPDHALNIQRWTRAGVAAV